ncbi:MAG: glycosyl transferase [Methanobrevibacter sp.]|nr:glycosyl transferase [Methanobrevibacter sp.]
MNIDANVENEMLLSLIKASLLELNEVKLNLTESNHQIEIDNSDDKIKELESLVLDKEKEVSLIKFKADEAVDILKEEIVEKDKEIQLKENKIYELNYVNTSLEEIKEYFAQQLNNYKNKELSEVNERLNKAYKTLAERDAYINNLTRQIDEFKIEIARLENDVDSQNKIFNLERELESRDAQISNITNQLKIIQEKSVPIEDFYYLKEELNKKDNKIKRLEEINEFFNELQEENEYYNSNKEQTPPFKLDKG